MVEVPARPVWECGACGQARPWQLVSDVVMGGISKGQLDHDDTGIAVFHGDLSLENDGGFVTASLEVPPLDLAPCTGLRVQARGDGRRYRLTLRGEGMSDGVRYQFPFETRGGDWGLYDMPLAEFVAMYRGRPVDEQPLERIRLTSVGLLIADGNPGRFELQLKGIFAV